MTRWKNLSGWGKWAALSLMLTLVLVVLSQGPVPSRSLAEGGDWKNVTLIYTTDIKGKIEPCG